MGNFSNIFKVVSRGGAEFKGVRHDLLGLNINLFHTEFKFIGFPAPRAQNKQPIFKQSPLLRVKQLVYQLRALNNKPYHTIHIQSISASPRFQSAEAGETYSCLCTRFLIIPPLVSRILLMTINADLSIFSISAFSLLTSKRVITV
jgi:hypothetical protein